MVEGGNGEGTNVRFWINSDTDYKLYTHFYDVCVKSGAVAYVAKYNTTKDANNGAEIAGSSINGVMTSEGDKTYAEFSVNLAEFGGADGFTYYVCVSNKVNENICLYNVQVPVGEDGNRGTNLPWKLWYFEGDCEADVEALALGEIVVEPETPDEPETPETPDEPEVPEENIEDELKEALGEANADAKFDLVIDAPETYKAGDEITVTVTVKNITAEPGLHILNFTLNYDNEKLLLTNDLDEEENNSLVCVDVDALPKGWENFSKVANDADQGNEVVLPLNDGIILASVLTDKDTASAALAADGAVVFTFTFTAKEDAAGDIGIVIPNATVEGAINDAAGATTFAGNGAYAIIAEEEDEPEVPSEDPSEEPSEPETPVKPGDASAMIVFAIIALVAVAGSAVVIKSRK
jgi:hypothetical protein